MTKQEAAIIETYTGKSLWEKEVEYILLELKCNEIDIIKVIENNDFFEAASIQTYMTGLVESINMIIEINGIENPHEYEVVKSCFAIYNKYTKKG